MHNISNLKKCNQSIYKITLMCLQLKHNKTFIFKELWKLDYKTFALDNKHMQTSI